jgi:hypothetical protein
MRLAQSPVERQHPAALRRKLSLAPTEPVPWDFSQQPSHPLNMAERRQFAICRLTIHLQYWWEELRLCLPVPAHGRKALAEDLQIRPQLRYGSDFSFGFSLSPLVSVAEHRACPLPAS